MKITPALVVLLLVLPACSRSNANSRVMLQNKGSDTLFNVAQAWAEKYREKDPTLAIAVNGGGSGTGITAMINGAVDIANASRKMKPTEIAKAKEHGVEPVEFLVGYDALAVYVHKDNPIESISLEQLAEIYGENGKVDSWDKLGITVPGCSSKEIIRVSRQNNSGTYVYFRNTVLGDKRDFKLGSQDMHGSKDVVHTVETTPCAIGYSGLAYATDTVRMVPIKATPEGAPVAPSPDSAVDKTYPIARPLFMYTKGQPKGKIKEYIDWILSDEGQRVIEKMGYAPVRKLPKVADPKDRKK